MFEKQSLKKAINHSKMRCERVESPRSKSVRARDHAIGDAHDRTVVLPNACGIHHISAADRFLGCTTPAPHQKMAQKEGVREQGTRQQVNEAKI